MNHPTIENEVCGTCGQDTTYVLAVDRGTAAILKQIARFIGRKGVNAVHPRKEMEGEWLTSNQVGNLSRARFHGLIARVKDNPGNYLLTKKGAAFLRGEPIPQYAIVRKGTVEQKGHNAGYYQPQVYSVTIHDIDGAYWEGIGYDVVEGAVIPHAQPTLV